MFFEVFDEIQLIINLLRYPKFSPNDPLSIEWGFELFFPNFGRWPQFAVPNASDWKAVALHKHDVYVVGECQFHGGGTQHRSFGEDDGADFMGGTLHYADAIWRGGVFQADFKHIVFDVQISPVGVDGYFHLLFNFKFQISTILNFTPQYKVF